VGLAGAVAAEASVGFLLFADEGLLQALTLILTVEMGALGLGLWSGPLATGGNSVEKIRRRWLFCLVAFALAAAVAGGLEIWREISATGVGQGLGLGFLGGLPLFSAGALLGALGRSDDPRGPPSRIGPWSVLGAALGFFVAGAFLIPSAAPYSLFLFSLVLLSGGALLTGWILDGRPVIEVLRSEPSSFGELRLERRTLGALRREFLVLTEGHRIRGVQGSDGEPGRQWEEAALTLAGHPDWCPDSFLLLGGGSGTLPHLLARRIPQARIQVVERSRSLVELAREGFGEWKEGEGEGAVTLLVAEPLEFVLDSGPDWSMVVFDAGALPMLGGIPFLTDGQWAGLARSVRPGGTLILGGVLDGENGGSAPLDELLATATRRFDGARLYRVDPDPGREALLGGGHQGEEVLVVLTRWGSPEWPDAIPGFGVARMVHPNPSEGV